MNRKNRVTIKSIIAAVLFGGSLLSSVVNANATLSLDYTLDSSNGSLASIYYDSTDFCLHGSNIAVTAISGIGTTQTGQNSLPVTSGLLNFVTGPLTGITGTTWNFAQGGSITVTGGITPLSITNVSTPLLSGTFNTASVTQMPLFGQLAFDILGGTFSVAGTQSIYNYYNVPSVSTSTDGINLSFLATTGISNSSLLSNSIGSGNILDTPSDNVGGNSGGPTTPVPAAIWLFGSGLIGLTGLRNNRFSKA